MKILVTGAAGMLGAKLVRRLGADHEVIATARRPSHAARLLDITDRRSVRETLTAERPDAVVNCAADTAVDECETNPERAYRVNAEGARNVALACERIAAVCVHVSTDYVFDGSLERPYTEYDETGPISVYGASKLAGERAVAESSSRWMIVRTCWLYGEDGPCFPRTILELAAKKDRLDVVDDQRGSPTYTGDVARQIAELLEADGRGVYHASAGGACTWFGFAREILDRAGVEGTVLNPVTTDRFPRPAPRPRNSVLRNMRLELTIGDGMRPWRDGLGEYLRRREMR